MSAIPPKSPKRIGLLAGAGDIPVYFAKVASQKGISVVSIGFSDAIDSRLEPYTEKNYSIGVGQVSKIFKTFRKENIEDLLFLGKVDKSVILQPKFFDFGALKFLNQIRNREDKTLLLGVIDVFNREGFNILDQREFLREIFPAAGVLTQRQPTAEEMEDIEFGFPIVRKLADMEVGQTIVVRKKTLLAVEAIEGTDRAIERGCSLARGKCVVLKVSRTDQDYRYDSPGVGPGTLDQVIRGGASVLAIEAGRVMLVNQSESIQMADEAGITLLSH